MHCSLVLYIVGLISALLINPTAKGSDLGGFTPAHPLR